MNKSVSLVYAIFYCVVCGVIWLVIGGLAGVFIGSALIQEEARGPMTGLTLGAPAGAVLGIVLGVFAMRRRSRTAK